MCSLQVQFQNGDNSNTTNNAGHPFMRIVNTGTSAQDLGAITLKYFYTSQNVLPTPEVDNYYASLNGSGITVPSTLSSSTTPVAVTFGAFSPATSTADSYFKLSFSAGTSVQPGQALELHLGLRNNPYGSNFDETKDYSFTAADMPPSFTTTDKITLYSAGMLIWGTEP
jgi:hypothetical protein